MDLQRIAIATADGARNSFVAALGTASITTQDFEGIGVGALGSVATDLFAKGVGSTLTNTATDHLGILDSTAGFDTYPISGKRFMEGLSDAGSTYFTATFDHTVRGIGFYVTDVSDWHCCALPPIGKLKVVLTTAGGTREFDLTPGFDPSELVNGNLAFFGVFDDADPFTSIAIRSESNILGGDSIGIDDVMISTHAVAEVPAPGTLGLLLGLLPALFRRAVNKKERS